MSTAQMRDLVIEINSLLSRPIGSAARVLSGQLIGQREQLKHLRSGLEHTQDPEEFEELQRECEFLIGQIQSQQKQMQFEPPLVAKLVRLADRIADPFADRPDRPVPPAAIQLPTFTHSPKLPQVLPQVLSVPTADSIKEISDMANRISDPATTLGAEEIAAIVRQTMSQTLAVERALIVGEVSANLRNLIESQNRSQASGELQELDRQKQNLRQEIVRLEQDRQLLLEQFKTEASRDRAVFERNADHTASIESSIQSLDSYVRDRIKHEIRQEVAEELAQTLASQPQNSLPSTTSVVANAIEQELIEKIKQQTDRFLLALDAMFTSTFQSLEHNIQGHQVSISEHFDQMHDKELTGEALLDSLVDRIHHQIGVLPSIEPELEPQIAEADNSIEPPVSESVESLDEELLESLIAGSLDAEELTSIQEVMPSPQDLAPALEEDSPDPLDWFGELQGLSMPESELESPSLDLAPEVALPPELETPEPILSSYTESEAPVLSPDVYIDRLLLDRSQEEDFSNFLMEMESGEASETESPTQLDPEDRFRFRSDDFNDLDVDPDFDPDAITLLADYRIPDRETPEPLDEDPELLAWLDQKSEPQSSQESIGSVDEDLDLLAWLESKSESEAMIGSSFSESSVDRETLSSWPEEDQLPAEGISDIDSIPVSEAGAEDLIDLIGINAADDARNSDESLILLPDVESVSRMDWVDDNSVLKDLTADLENLDAGLGLSPLIASNLELMIRNTPFSQNDVRSNPSAQVGEENPSIAKSQVTDLQLDQLAEIPEIVEDVEALFADIPEQSDFAGDEDLFIDSFLDRIVGEASETIELTPPVEDVEVETHEDISSSNLVSDLGIDLAMIPDIVEDPESLFSESTSDHSLDDSATDQDELDEFFAEFPSISPDLVSTDISESVDSDADTLLLEPPTKDTQTASPEVETVLSSSEASFDRELLDLMESLDLDLDSDDHVSLPDLRLVEEFETVLQGFADNDDLNMLLGDLESPLFTQADVQMELNQNPPLDLETDDRDLEEDVLSDELLIAIEDARLTKFADRTSWEDDSDPVEDEPLSQVEKQLTEFADTEPSWEEFIANAETPTGMSVSDLGWDTGGLNSPRDNPETTSFISFLEAESEAESNTNFLDVDSVEVNISIDLQVAAIPTPAIPTVPKPPNYQIDDTWFLGVDFGSTAIRASILNANTGEIYPLSFDRSPTLKSVAVFVPEENSGDPVESTITLTLSPDLPTDSIEDPQVLPRTGNGNGSSSGKSPKYISGFKHLLKLGLPYNGINSWQPVVQWHGTQKITLRWVMAVVKQLLLEIKSATHQDLPDAEAILANLSGVILGHPPEWSDTYALNLREAVLHAGLVSQAEQVMIAEQSIAPLLTLIHANRSPQQITLAIDSGTVTTSLLLIKGNPDGIKRSDLNYRSFDYAGAGIDQDIVTQLLYPHWRLITNPERDACNLEHLELPAPSHSDPANRALLQQYLLTSTVGEKLLDVAEQLKLELSDRPQSEQWMAEVNGLPLIVLRRELESQVFLPFRQSLNHQLNDLLSNSGISTEDITEVWQIGGTMAIPFITSWLEQKLPNLQKITPLPDSIVADGLAVAPLYRHLLNVARQQYSDYFLLQEMCRLNLQNAVSFTGLMHQLQNRGINTRACRDRIGNILQGDLPAGLFPWLEPEKGIVLLDPAIDPELFTGRLFEPETDGTYQPNLSKFQLLRAYLQSILGTMHQTLNEPLVFPEVVICR